MLDNSPVVSVLTAVYNNEDYIISALDSIKNQTYPKEKIEHYIINDSSPGSMKNIFKWLKTNKYKHKYILNKNNLGFTRTINKFLLLSKGKYFSMIADDIWDRERIEKLVSTFEKLPYDDYALIFSDMQLINSNGELTHDSYISKRNGNKNELKKSNFDHTLAYLKEQSCVGTPSCLWSTKAVQNIGLYNHNMAVEDYDMHLRLSLDYKFLYLDEKLIRYRTHQDSLSNKIGILNSYYRVLTYSTIIDKIPQEYFKILKNKIVNHSQRFLDIERHNKKKINIFFLLFNSLGLFSTIKVMFSWQLKKIRNS